MADLKSITLDGVSLRNLFTDTDIGKQDIVRSSNVSVPANTKTLFSPVTITDAGVYHCLVFASIDPATTASTMRIAAVQFNGTGLNTQGIGIMEVVPRNIRGTIFASQMFEVTEAMLPVTVTCALYFQHAETCASANTYVTKIAKYPGLEE